ncbi:MAG: thiamine-phosphate kinase [Methanobrevibacter sp.]|jgi:thiamine-monophosphate kinase|nr:thiamine-phosphate kinase [Candidatus Methanoflexus mossambicus]
MIDNNKHKNENKHKNGITLKDLGEKKLVSRIIKRNNEFFLSNGFKNSYLSFLNHNLLDINGDDAAVIDLGDFFITVSSDTLIEKNHFPKGMSYFQMGWKSVVVNFSDLNAMNSKPLALLINISLPSILNIDDFDELIDGIMAASLKYNLPLIGGDTNQSEEIIISGTAIGINKKESNDSSYNSIFYKYGFNVDDLIAINGFLGLAAIGFLILNSKKDLDDIKHDLNSLGIEEKFISMCMAAVFQPNANTHWPDEKDVLSATDITDGLASELHEMRIANINHCLKNNNQNNDNLHDKSFNDFGFLIYEENIPYIDEIKQIAKFFNKNYLDLIFNFGEDFNLIFIIKKDYNDFSKNITEFSKNINDINKNDNLFAKIKIIGQVTNTNKIELKLKDNAIMELNSKGFQHFNNSN